MTKKKILNRWKRLATSADLDEAIQTPASDVWHFLERLLQREDDKAHTEFNLFLSDTAQLSVFENGFLDLSAFYLALIHSNDKWTYVISDGGVLILDCWMMGQKPYPDAERTYQEIYSELVRKGAVASQK